jgi:hypothetical protein
MSEHETVRNDASVARSSMPWPTSGNGPMPGGGGR